MEDEIATNFIYSVLINSMVRKWLVCLLIVFLTLPLLTSVKSNEKVEAEVNDMDFIMNGIERLQKNNFSEESIQLFIKELQERFGGDSIYINAMCKVAGIGGGILFPPFLPVSPVLIAFPITLLRATGLMRDWSHGVQLAIFISFVGLPLYITPPPIYIIAGVAGIVIGIVFD